MKHPQSCFKLGVCALAFGLSGWANAACNMVGTNATSVQADSGNGNYVCSLVSTSSGPLLDVSADPSGLKYTITNGQVNWTVPVNANGYPLFDVDLVSVSDSKGKRCNYSYANQTAAGTGLSTPDSSSVPKTVVVCADTIIVAEPPPPPPVPPEPFSTTKDGCDATFASTSADGKFDVAIGYSKQQDGGTYEGVAICAGPGQMQCINECVPREYDSSCQADSDGRYPLSCAQCEWDAPPAVDSLFGKDMKYCWNYENRVVIPDPENEPNTGTFKPSPKKKSVSTQIDVSTGSNCYTVTTGPLYGGKTYSYWYCSQ